MSKGKEHKRYEFGTQVSITTTGDSKIIVGAMAFDSNKFDGHTLPEVLLQLKRLNALNPAVGLCDRGYKGKIKINDTRILRPGTTTRDTDSAYQALMRKRFRKRAGIEPVMGHLKDNVNYLSHIILKGVAQFVKTVIIKPMLQTIEDHPNGRYDKVNEQSDSN